MVKRTASVFLTNEMGALTNAKLLNDSIAQRVFLLCEVAIMLILLFLQDGLQTLGGV